MSTRKTTLFYVLLIAVASMAVGMVLASRLDLTPPSSAQTVAVPPMNSAPINGPLDAQTFRNIAKAQTPMVVSIRTEMKAHSETTDFFGGGGAPEDFFHRFFGQPPGQGQGQGQQDQPGQGGRRRQREPIAHAEGSGFIISKDGFIVTNNHVVEDAMKIQVSLFGDDETQYDAKVVGHDQLTDTALVQLVDKPKGALPEARFGDSSQMAPGDWVMAIGNPFQFQYTVTVGVISASQRSLRVTEGRNNDMLQTDAAINPGNSGGPLLNIRGEVIGMNTMIISGSRSEGNLGIGFAVPSNTIRDLLPQLRTGKITRGRIGVLVTPVPREDFQEFGLKSRAGAVVTSVAPGGASAKAGIEPGDVIVEFNGRPVSGSDDLVKMVVGTKPGTTVPVKVIRNRQEKTLNLTVDELDLEAEQSASAGRGNRNESEQPEEETTGSGFGLTLRDLTPAMVRRLQLPSGRTGALVSDVDPNGPSAGALRAGDVILSVNGKNVSGAQDVRNELQKIPSGRIARILLWRGDGEVFITVKKD
jgi:serine protease Do